ncbi:hypothetical protein NODU109028_06300 [Nocardioides dubius]
MRLARADAAAEELSRVALSWSRGTEDQGAITLRQVERTPGIYDVEVASIRPVPPVAGMLFSEAVHHMRSAVDNVGFYVAEQEHGQPLGPQQERAVSMLVYDEASPYERKWKGLVRQGLAMFDPRATLGKRVESLQPFNDPTSIGSLSPILAYVMGVEAAQAQPLALLRDYSNADKHRALRATAGHTLVQRYDDWQRSVSQGMRQMEVGTVLEQVTKGVLTPVEVSPALLVHRPDGTPVAPGPELDGMARHVADIVIPTLLRGIALPDGIPAHIDLTDNGETFAERLAKGSTVRAHVRARPVMEAALIEAEEQHWRFPAIADDEE